MKKQILLGIFILSFQANFSFAFDVRNPDYALVEGVETNDANLVLQALEGGANPNLNVGYLPPAGDKPLMTVAPLLAQAPVLRLLIAYGGDLNSVDQANENALHKLMGYCPGDETFLSNQKALSEEDRIENIKVILAKVPLNNLVSLRDHACRVGAITVRKGFTPFQLAVLAADEKVLTVLSGQKNLPVNALINGKSPLMLSGGKSGVVQWLLSEGADPSLLDPDHRMAIHWMIESDTASEEEIIASVQLLIQAKVNVNAMSSQGETPLSLAIKKGRLALVKRLIASGANVNLKTVPLQRPLVVAASVGRFDIVQELVHAGVDMGRDGPNALAEALARQDFTLAEKIMSLGTSLNSNALTDDEKSVLILALALQKSAYSSYRLKILAYYQQNHAPINSSTPGVSTPLMMAAKEGWTETVSAMVTAGAEVNPVVDGTTALSLALDNSRCEIAQALLSANADPNLPSSGVIPKLAIQKKCFSKVGASLIAKGAQLKGFGLLHSLAEQRDLDGLTLILKGDVDLEEKVNGESPLLMASQIRYPFSQGWIAGAQLLIERGASPNILIYGTPLLIQSLTGKTQPLVEAIFKSAILDADLKDGYGRNALYFDENSAELTLLVKKGAKLNVKDLNSETAVFSHVRQKHLSAVKTLIGLGGDPNVKNAYGVTAVGIAIQGNDIQMAILLCRSGATDKACEP